MTEEAARSVQAVVVVAVAAAGGGEEMAAQDAASVKRSGHSCVEDLGACVLCGGGVACRAAGCERSYSGVGGGAGGRLEPSKHG